MRHGWHRLWGSIWHALGSNSAGVPLFRKHASRTRSSAMSTYYEPILFVQLSAMRLSICPCFCCVFTGFEDAVRHRLWGSIWHALGSNSAGVPLFRKHASRMRSSAMSAYTRRYVQLSAMRLSIHAFVHAFSCFFSGFPAAVRHRLWGSIWHALGSNSAGVPLFRQHASRMRSSAMSAYMRLYVQLYPP